MISLISLLLGIFMVVVDGTLMNVSLLQVASTLNITLESMQTLITFYSLVTGAFLLLGGKLADVYGRKKIFTIGAILFGIGSLLSATAPNGTVLFVGWSVIEGIGAALMMPASTSIIVDTFKGKERALAFGLWGATASVGAALGPIIGGAITTYASWRYAFLLQVILAIFVVLTSRKLKESRPLANEGVDLVGAFLSIVGISLFMWGILKARVYGWFFKKQSLEILGVNLAILGLSPAFWGIIVGLLIIIIFAIYQLKIKKPLLNVRIFKHIEFTLGLFVTSFVNLAMAGMMFVFPIYFQVLKSYSALTTGIKLLPITIGVFLSSIIGSKWQVKDKLTIVIGTGIVLLSAGLLYFRSFPTPVNLVNGEEGHFILPFFLFGFGLGFIMAKLTNIVMTGVPAKFAGEASGVNSTIRRLASSFGTAIVGTLFFNAFENSNFYKWIIEYATKIGVGSVDIRIIPKLLKHLPAPSFKMLYLGFVKAVLESIKYVLVISIGMFGLLLIVVALWYFKSKNVKKRV